MPVQPKDQQARQALAQSSQQLLTQIVQLANQAEQAEPDQSLKELASEIATLAGQVKFNQQTQQRL